MSVLLDLNIVLISHNLANSASYMGGVICGFSFFLFYLYSFLFSSLATKKERFGF